MERALGGEGGGGKTWGKGREEMMDFTPISAREDMLLFPSGDSGGQAGRVGCGPLAAGVPDSQLVHEEPRGLLGRECQLAASGAGRRVRQPGLELLP